MAPPTLECVKCGAVTQTADKEWSELSQGRQLFVLFSYFVWNAGGAGLLTYLTFILYLENDLYSYVLAVLLFLIVFLVAAIYQALNVLSSLRRRPYGQFAEKAVNKA